MDFTFFYSLFGSLIAFFYSVVPSYGFAIIALTLSVMIVLTPLTLKGTRSMMMMQQLQPEMKKLQSRYKDDRQKLNEELLKFYKENNINPVGGCLPLLVQMPVFLVLYNVLRGLTQRIPSTGSSAGWVTGQFGSGTPLTKPPVVLNNFDPEYVPHDSSLYQSLSHTNTMAFFGMDLSESCSTALQRGPVHALPYLVLIVIVGISGFVQQRQIQGRTPNAQVNAQQQQIMKIMPIFLPVISFTLPAGLVLYFAISNLYRIGQQWFISRSIYGIKKGENESTAALAKESTSSGKGGASKGRSGGATAKKSASTASSTTSASGSRSSKAGTAKSVPADGGDGDATRGKDRSNGAPSRAPSRDPKKRTKAAGQSDASTSTPSSEKAEASKKRTTRTSSGSVSRDADTPDTSTKTTSSAASDGDGATRPPTLQPRARKKKR